MVERFTRCSNPQKSSRGNWIRYSDYRELEAWCSVMREALEHEVEIASCGGGGCVWCRNSETGTCQAHAALAFGEKFSSKKR